MEKYRFLVEVKEVRINPAFSHRCVSDTIKAFDTVVTNISYSLTFDSQYIFQAYQRKLEGILFG